MATYDFRLPSVRVTVTTGRGEFTAEVIDVATDQVIGRGRDYSEPGAVGLAILAARSMFATCNGCGQRFYKDEMGQDVGGYYYCFECAYDREIVKAPAGW